MKVFGAAAFALVMGASALVPFGPFASATPASAALSERCQNALVAMSLYPQGSAGYDNAVHIWNRYC